MGYLAVLELCVDGASRYQMAEVTRTTGHATVFHVPYTDTIVTFDPGLIRNLTPDVERHLMTRAGHT